MLLSLVLLAITTHQIVIVVAYQRFSFGQSKKKKKANTDDTQIYYCLLLIYTLKKKKKRKKGVNIYTEQNKTKKKELLKITVYEITVASNNSNKTSLNIPYNIGANLSPTNHIISDQSTSPK